MLIFPMYENFPTAPIEISRVRQHRRPGVVQHVTIWDHCTPKIGQGAMILLTRVFTKENMISSLKQSSSPLFLQEFRPMIPLKTTDRFTSLMIIGVMKIMCNNVKSCFD
jgi:hypothetical protein